MASIVYPTEDPYVYNTLIIGPHVIPGRAELIDGIKTERDIDVKKAKQKSGAKVTDNGAKEQRFKFRIHQHKQLHHDAWQRIFPQINPNREGATSEPFEIMNAYTWEQDIHEARIVSIKPMPYNSKLQRDIEIEFMRWTNEPKNVKLGTGTAKPLTADKEVRAMTGDLLGMSLAPGQLTPEPVLDPNSTENISSMVGEMMGMSR